MRRAGACLLILLAAHGTTVRGQQGVAPLPVLDVPFISQTEALCGGAAAAMVLRFWGERDVSADAFAHLVDRSAAGIRTEVLIRDLRARGWDASGVAGSDELLGRELTNGRPVVTLIEDHPGVYHYVVVVARHDRGVVFHDPARLPFRVMGADEFSRRWKAADRWMAVIVPGAAFASSTPAVPPPVSRSSCDELIEEGVAAARDNQLQRAERALASAVSCPGSAAARELAGVRLLQQRWPDVDALASAAVAQDPGDSYAWKLLGTARFIEDDPRGALDAWNQTMEPRIDVVQVEGLTHTRHRVVERLLNVQVNDVLTAKNLMRAQRRLRDLPSAVSTRLQYTPAPSGRAELRGVVVERPLVPASPFSLAALGLSAAVAREVRVVLGSMTGGGEAVAVDWRFWENRRRLAAGVRAPAPWGGVWGVDGFQERQGFTASFPDVERTGVQLAQSNWANGAVRWSLGGGVDRWREGGTFSSLAGGAVLASRNDRLIVAGRTTTWLGSRGFSGGTASLRLRSSVEPRGMVWRATVALDAVSARAPLDLWPAGDTGAARTTLLRAHPVLSNGRIRVSRIGRIVESSSVEGQRWWRIAGPIRGAAAAFVDAARTSRRADPGHLQNLDAGIGARFTVSGLTGTLRIDLATGSDGASALSFVYVVD